MSDEVSARIGRHNQLWNDAGNWRRLMAQVSDLVRPVRSEIRGHLTDGGQRLQNVYDATGIIANNNLGAAVYGSASNPADQWFRVGSGDKDLDKWPQANSALAKISKRLLASYGPSYSNFYGQTYPFYLDLTGLGTAYFYQAVREDHSGFIDKCLPLSECEFDVDAEGNANEFYRKWPLSIGAAAKMFGKEKLSPESFKKLETHPEEKIAILHTVCANDDYVPGRLGQNRKRFSSYYDEVTAKHAISEGGFDDFPFYVTPWERAAGERKGRGAGEIALADLLSLQVMQKANLMGGEWQANMPFGMVREGIDVSRLRPGDIVAGAISPRGDKLLQALDKGTGTPFSIEVTNQLRQAIKDAFEGAVITVVAAGRTGMTSVEVLDVREEKFRRMAPYQGNITTHFLQPHVARRYKLLKAEGVFADIAMPKELANRDLQFDFISPMALAQKAAKASNAMRAVGALAQAVEIDPSVADRFNGDAYAKTILEAYEPGIMNDDDVTAARAQGRQQQAMQLHQAEMAQQLAVAAKNGVGAVAQLRQPAPAG